MRCRHCSSALDLTMVDLGLASPSNAYVKTMCASLPETRYPLRVLVCESCWLVQTEDFTRFDELFDDEYAYFSSFSSTWLSHAKAYVDLVTTRFNLTSSSLVLEVASNDGYLLKNFLEMGIPCFGVEPTKSTSAAAKRIGLNIVEEFFTVTLAEELLERFGPVDLALGNNVLAHVPDINDFVAGFHRILKPNGVVTFEFPHLLNLIKELQFDTIYHEHYSYLSLYAVQGILKAQGLHIFDVDELSTHGGSLRVYAQRSDVMPYTESSSVTQLLWLEEHSGLLSHDVYKDFSRRVFDVKIQFLNELIQAKKAGKTIVAYGAAAKGNTLLNYLGVTSDFIDYVVDKNPYKQGKLLPGSRIPIVDQFKEDFDLLIILPWNLTEEIISQLENSVINERHQVISLRTFLNL